MFALLLLTHAAPQKTTGSFEGSTAEQTVPLAHAYRWERRATAMHTQGGDGATPVDMPSGMDFTTMQTTVNPNLNPQL